MLAVLHVSVQEHHQGRQKKLESYYAMMLSPPGVLRGLFGTEVRHIRPAPSFVWHHVEYVTFRLVDLGRRLQNDG